MKTILLFLAFICVHHGIAQTKPYLTARTIGALPFLEYGIGDDRLGGAKFGFLDSNILLKIVDSIDLDYKVLLSEYHSAYISKTQVRIIGRGNTTPVHNHILSGSWKVYGDSTHDIISIGLNEKVPFKSQQEINPSRLVVDLYGVTSNTNWVTQLKSAREIKNTWYEQTEDDVLRVIIELKHSQHWGHSISYDSATGKLMIRVKRPPVSNDIKKLRIAIDPGHGGENPGADGVSSKILEKEYTLKIASDLQATLKKAGVRNIFMTRTKDTTLGMPERIMMLKQFKPDILISIHLNSSSSDTVRGTSTYYRYIGFRSLSQQVLSQMLTLGLQEYGNVGHFNFALSGPTEYPNCLVEVAFLSNLADEKKILDPKFRKAVAQKIYIGIVNWLKTIK